MTRKNKFLNARATLQDLVEKYRLLCSRPAATMAPAQTLTRDEVASAQLKGDYAIKPEDSQPKLDTSQWPLLLKT